MEIDEQRLLEMAADRIANAVDLDRVDDVIKDRVSAAIAEVCNESLRDMVDRKLAEELESLVAREFIPVDMWGEQTGQATTIRAQLHKKAMEFWETKINKDGKEDRWGEPRHKRVYEKVVGEQFRKAIDEHAAEVVAAFKVAASKELTQAVQKSLVDAFRKQR